MNDFITITTGLNFDQRSHTLRWLAKQAETIRIEIMMGRFKTFHSLRKRHKDIQAPMLDYCALLKACQQHGCQADTSFRTSKQLSPKEIHGIHRRRKLIAQDMVRRKKITRDKLATNWGKVVELRSEGVSFRGIANFFKDQLNVNVSHMTIWSYWQKWKSHGHLPSA